MTDSPAFRPAASATRAATATATATAPAATATNIAPTASTAPKRTRHDGWTHARQAQFLQSLAESGCVEHAARAAGMSVSGAYRLRNRQGGRAFAEAWEAAIDLGARRLADAALARAIYGVTQPVFYRGEVIGERRVYNDRLTMFLLRMRDPLRFGAPAASARRWLTSHGLSSLIKRSIARIVRGARNYDEGSAA